MESTFTDQNNPKRQTASFPWGSNLDLIIRVNLVVYQYPRSPIGLFGCEPLSLGVFSGGCASWCAGYSQPSCPALPSAQTDGTLLGPASRHARRRLSPQPDRLLSSAGIGFQRSVLPMSGV